jgi:serine/threonine-protein kinase
MPVGGSRRSLTGSSGTPAAIESLRDVQIEQVTARPRTATNLSLRIPAGGARLISVEVPAAAGLVLGINGTPLMEMTVFRR